jgi:adenylosuccinate lyase
VTENVLMAAVKKGGDRQLLHERLRVLAQAAGDRLKDHGGANDLLSRIAKDPAFHLTAAELEAAADPSRFVGRAPEQVDEFLDAEIAPILASDRAAAEEAAEEVRV